MRRAGARPAVANVVKQVPDQFTLAAEFIGRTAEAWRRRALAAEEALAAAERDRAGAIARLAELTSILRLDLERDESRHCDCCYRARQTLAARPADVIPFRAVEHPSGRSAGSSGRPGRSRRAEHD